MIDYHTHHWRCGHATGELEDYIKQGIKLGLEEIGLSDHLPLIHVNPDEEEYQGIAMRKEELPYYVEEALRLQEKYQKEIKVKVGIEADYVAGYEEEIEKLLSPYPFDYVIGSVHFLGDWDFSDSRRIDNYLKYGIDKAFSDYYLAVMQAAKSNLYDIIGHFDVIKKYGFQPTIDLSDLQRETLQVIKGHNKVIELNTSGIMTKGNEFYPAPQVLSWAKELGIPLTLGSDAHKPQKVALYHKEALKLIKGLGFSELATFTKRKITFLPLR